VRERDPGWEPVPEKDHAPVKVARAVDFTAAAAYNALITGSLGGSPHARLARYLMRD
jgi:hypothetical protein